MKMTSTFSAWAGAAVLVAATLTGCASAGQPDKTKDAVAESSTKFLACLKAAGVDAKISDIGQVLVKQLLEPADDGTISAESRAGSSDDEAVMFAVDDDGNAWVAATSADYFEADPTTQDAYKKCEADVPDFTQPAFDPESDPKMAQGHEDAVKAAQKFATCARENGFTAIADPDPEMGDAIVIPDDFTEDDFRSLLTACFDPDESGFAFSGSTGSDLDWAAILEEFQL